MHPSLPPKPERSNSNSTVITTNWKFFSHLLLHPIPPPNPFVLKSLTWLLSLNIPPANYDSVCTIESNRLQSPRVHESHFSCSVVLYGSETPHKSPTQLSTASRQWSVSNRRQSVRPLRHIIIQDDTHHTATPNIHKIHHRPYGFYASMSSFKENLSGFFPWDLPVVKISPEWMISYEKELDIDNKLHNYLKITGIINNVFR